MYKGAGQFNIRLLAICVFQFRVLTMTTTKALAPTRIPRRFTVAEYYRMAEVGILHHTERMELIDGEIVNMAPIGSRHAGCVHKISHLFRNYEGNLVIVGIQSPVQLGEHSEPEPDVALLRARSDFYTDAHPGPADVLLLVEVSDTTLNYDRNVKVPLYARSGIPEIWLVNLEEDCIEVYSNPAAAGYRQSTIVHRGEQIAPTALPGLELNGDDILPPPVVAEQPAGNRGKSDSPPADA